MRLNWNEFLKCGTWVQLDNDRVIIGWGMARKYREQPSTGHSFLVRDYFESRGTVWRTHIESEIIKLNDLKEAAQKAHGDLESVDLLKTLSWHEPEYEDFQKVFQTVRQRILEKKIQKAVPIAFAIADHKPSFKDKLTMFIHSLNLHRGQAYGFWEGDEGMIGVSPEVLFSRAGQTIDTMALAGTRQSNIGNEVLASQLITDSKEVAEHHFVVQDISEVLNSLGEIMCSPMEVVEVPGLLHLRTKIRLTLNSDISFIDLVNRLHPTPALGIYPRSKDNLWFKQLPGQDIRKKFGAPFGVSYEDRGQNKQLCLVAIRNLQWSGARLLLGSGCGVVENSEAEREWKELSAKRDSVKRMMGFTE